MRSSLLTFAPVLASLALAIPGLAQKPEHPGDAVRSAFFGGSAWRDFLENTDGEWRVEWNVATGTPKAIYGTGVAIADWRENSLPEARRHAWQLLEDQHQLLGLGNSAFRESVGSRMGRTWSFTYDQYYRDLPVIGGRADVRVNSSGRISMFGSSAWQLPEDFTTTPSMTAETATLIAWQALGETPVDVAQPGEAVAPRLVIWGDVHATTPQTPALAWEIQVRNVGADGRGRLGNCYIDAGNGALLRFVDGRHHCDANCVHSEPPHPAAVATPKAPPTLTTVEFHAWVQEGVDAYDPLVDRRMVGLVVTVPGVGTYTTNANGRISIDIAAPVTITVTPVDGRHHAPITGPSAPPATFTVTPGVFQQLYIGSTNQTPDETAHCNAALWTDRVNEYVRRILLIPPQTPFLDDLDISVNQAQTCNAYYFQNSINFYHAGGGCSNTAVPSVVLHEWGHALDTHFGGIGSSDGITEGWADVISLYVLDAPLVGSGVQVGGSLPRDGNNTLQYPFGLTDHQRGNSYMGFAWKLRERLAQTLGNRSEAIAITEQIVVSTCVANPYDQPAAVLESFLADDDDGDLNNGTPHAAELIWACQRHSLPYPGPSGVPNDQCSYALQLHPGINGPFTTIGAGSSSPAWSCAAAANDVWFRLPISAAGTLQLRTCGLAAWDTTIELFTGDCGNLQSIACDDDGCPPLRSSLIAPVQPGVYYARVGGYHGATGDFSLEVNGPIGDWARSSSFGNSCGSDPSGFHEMFPQPLPFDLANTSLVMARQGSSYLVQAGGGFVPPTPAATMLALTDDSEITVNLNGVFVHPGGSTSTLTVCSNGYVSAGAGNPTIPWVNPTDWYAAAEPRWGTWQDFVPSPSNGQVSFEQVGSIAYVTWNAVKLYHLTAYNTMQLQFDLSNGNVTMAWQNMVTGGSAIVGYASATSSTVQSNTDISAALPGTFAVETLSFNSISSTLPRIGSTLTVTTTFSGPFPLGIQVIGFSRYPLGLSLDSLGMPGCKLYESPDLLYVILPGGNQMTWSLPLPMNGALVGTELTAQSASFSSSNAAGLITSAGLALKIGL